MPLLNPKNHDYLARQLMRQEGRRVNTDGEHLPYRDALGILTLGYGHNSEALPLEIIAPASGRGRGAAFDPEKDTLSEAQARALLEEDIARTEAELESALPWIRTLTQIRRAVLINMAFNMGVPKLLGFKFTLGYLRSGSVELAAQEMLRSKWAKQVGARAVELADQLEAGEWMF